MAEYWGHGNLGGSAAAGGLNLKIVSSTYQPSAPSDDQQALIWANTSVKIPAWAITDTLPTHPMEGMLQIRCAETGTAINLLKKNSAILHVIGLRQYVSGAWHLVAGGLWSAGKWTLYSTVPYLYNNGVAYTDFAGQIKTRGLKYAQSFTGTSPDAQLGKSSMIISIPGGPTNAYGLAYYSKDIDLTPYKSLKAVLKRNKAKVASMPERFASVGVYQPQAAIDWLGIKSKALVAEATPAEPDVLSTISIDLTNINGPHTIGYWVGENCELEIQQVWLE